MLFFVAMIYSFGLGFIIEPRKNKLSRILAAIAGVLILATITLLVIMALAFVVKLLRDSFSDGFISGMITLFLLFVFLV